MKKLLEAVPNTLIFVGCIGLVLALFSPFLLEMIGGRPKQGTITLQEDSENLPGVTESETEPDRPSRAMQLLPAARPFNHHAGIILEEPAARLQERFIFRLVSKPQASPQVHEAHHQKGFEYLRASYYDGKLKEFVIVYPPRPASLDELAMELFTEFGEVPAWLRGREEDLTRVGQVTVELVEKLLAYPNHRQLAWSDGDNRVDATIYSQTDPDGQSHSVLAVQVSAAQWIKEYKAKRESGIAATLPDKPQPSGGVTEPSGPGPQR